MKRLLRWIGRVAAAVVVLVLILLAPVAWTEAMCRGTPVADTYQPLVAPEWRRAEGRSYTTYPEWHIVHAYEDYAKVIATGDPHDFGFLRAIGGFWSSLCPLARVAAAHGGFDGESKATIYTIGVSFTLEMALKAAYEETLGRIASWVRGAQRAPLDDISARQAADYAVFLRQTPWYKWDFQRDAGEFDTAAPEAFRDRERQVALGIEYRAKAAYAGVIAAAVTATGTDELRIRSVVTGLTAEALGGMSGVQVIAEWPEGVEIETDRYAAFTDLARSLANAGAEFVEIAGNDDILVTVLTDRPSTDVLHAARRQGFDDWRELREVRVADLGGVLRSLATGPARLEHIHDY